MIMHGIYGKAPLTALIRQGRGRALAIGTTNDLSICSTANHGPPSRSGPGASAPPSPIVNEALLTGTVLIIFSQLLAEWYVMTSKQF